MVDWIHCNKCFLQFRPNVKFYVTTCGHLKCQICVSKMGPENRCLVCNSECKMVVLSNNLPADVMFYFQPATEAIDKAYKVSAFQLNNTLSLLRTMKAKYNAAKAELAKTYKTVQELKKEQHSLTMMLKSATRPTGFPASGVGSSSMMSENTVSPRDLNMTAPSNASSNSFMQFESPNPRNMPWNQPRNAARMMMHRQYPGIINSFTSQSDLSYSGSQEQSSAPFDISASPNVLTNRPHLSRRNPSMGSMSSHHMGLGNKPR